MRTISYRLAGAADARAVLGDQSIPTMHAVAILADGEPRGLIGVARRDGYCMFFSETDQLEPPELKQLGCLRALKRAMKIVASTPGPVTSISQNAELMERLGFKPVNDEGLYLWT